MMKNEFEEMIGRSVTDEEYQLIEEVYMYHPAIRTASGKEEVAELYKSFGIVIFYDMYPRTQKAKEIEENIRLIDKTRAELVDELKRLKKENEYGEKRGISSTP
nr:MAG TPA: hypothetical protein [Caudoviricetes sp.]